MTKITAEIFTKAVGRPPEKDDLVRCNCDRAGVFGHWSCGWDAVENKPVFLSSQPFRPPPPPNTETVSL